MNPSWLKNHDVRIFFVSLLLNTSICDNILLPFNWCTCLATNDGALHVHVRVSLQKILKIEFSFQTAFVTNKHLDFVDFV